MDEFARDYFDVSETMITWWLNLGAVAALIAFPFTTKYLAGRAGLRQICLWCGFGLAFAAWLRLLPVATGQQTSTWSVVVIFIAQFIIGVAGPAVMAAPPLLSGQWFAEHERTRATAISCLSNNFGSAVGFLLGSQLVAAAGDVPTVCRSKPPNVNHRRTPHLVNRFHTSLHYCWTTHLTASIRLCITVGHFSPPYYLAPVNPPRAASILATLAGYPRLFVCDFIDCRCCTSTLVWPWQTY